MANRNGRLPADAFASHVSKIEQGPGYVILAYEELFAIGLS